MLSFCPTYTFPSDDGGVSFVIRRLSVIARANRDLEISDHQLRYDELLEELQALPKEPNEDNADQRRARRRLNAEIESLANLHIKPVVMRAGLVEVKGVEIDGRPITIDEFLQFGDENLIEQAFVLCELASRLTADKLKKLQSFGTSPGPVAQPSENSSAAIAEQLVPTNAETVESTSQTT